MIVPASRTIDTPTLQACLASPDPPLVLFVASPNEFRRGRIPGARSLDGLEALRREVPPDRPIVVTCRDDAPLTAAWACRLLFELGYRDVVLHTGGLEEWKTAGLPVERSW